MALQQNFSLRFAAPAILGLILAASPGVGRAAPTEKSLPPWAKVQAAVTGHFAAIAGRQAGDLIVRSEVEPLLAKLKQMGWTVADRSSLLDRVCDDGEFLARELRTPTGQRFMQRITSFPGGYDCLDRLGRLAHGRQTVHDLIYKTGGPEMIEYMTTTKGGRNMEKMLARVPQGEGFGEPTGRIYTVNMLSEELRKSHAAATGGTKKADTRRP
jgi:hypothetical protein